MAAFESVVAHAPDLLRADGVVQWAARNSAKPGRKGPECWVIQASADWSATHIETPADTVLAALLDTFAARVGAPLPATLTAQAHRWRYARAGPADAGPAWIGDLGLGVCGDWLLGPSVECAWLSGRATAAEIGSDRR